MKKFGKKVNVYFNIWVQEFQSFCYKIKENWHKKLKSQNEAKV